MGLREEILAIQDHRVEPFPTPEWQGLDGKVFIRTITARDKGAIEKLTCDSKTGEVSRLDIFTAVYAAKCMCDENGTPIFTEDDIDALSQKNAGVIERAFRAVKKLNGLSEEAIADAEKNSAKTTTSDSSTPFPLPLE
jgi:hypothetical protein